MTSLSAATFGMVNRGLIKEGYDADLVLFDPSTIIDSATYDAPQSYPEGIHSVIVNGKLAFQQGQHLNAGSGKMLRYRRSAYGE